MPTFYDIAWSIFFPTSVVVIVLAVRSWLRGRPAASGRRKTSGPPPLTPPR